MNIMDVCDSPDVLSTMKYVKTVITIIRIAVPILLIVAGTLTLVKTIKSGESDLSKSIKSLVIKVIIALLIFFIPTFVSLIGDLFDNNLYKECISNATDDNIDRARYERAKQKVDAAYESLLDADYNIARNLVYDIKTESLKSELEERLKIIKEYINLKRDILLLKNLSGKEFRDKYKELYAKIEAITDEKKKEYFIELISQYGYGRPLDVKPGTYYNQKYEKMIYHLVIPPDPTSGMPLWIFLHGDEGLRTGGLTKHVASGKAFKTEGFFYIAPSPKPYNRDWTKHTKELKELIDYLVDEYEIDEDRIIISGTSAGAIMTWKMVDKYPDMFSVAYPISCWPRGCDAKNFTTTIVRAHAGNLKGEENGWEGNYASSMNDFVKKIKEKGGDATMTIHKGKAHGGVNYVLEEDATIEFALKQVKKR